MNQKAPSQKRSMYLAVSFTVLVVVLIIVAIIIRLILLFSHSTFDSRSSYILETTEKNNQALIFVFSPDTQTISQIHIIAKNMQNIGKQMEVPIDAYVATSIDFANMPVSKILWNLFIHFHAYPSSRINQADMYKLFLFSQTIKTPSITTQTVHLPLTDQTEIQSIPQLASDHTLFQEGETIAVVNATGLSGRGSQLTKLLTNIGANVISVTTADSEQGTSVIYTNIPQTYTVKRLKKILGFPIKTQKPPISDILIIIGTDTNQSDIF